MMAICCGHVTEPINKISSGCRDLDPPSVSFGIKGGVRGPPPARRNVLAKSGSLEPALDAGP
jgi:hypothetical protein